MTLGEVTLLLSLTLQVLAALLGFRLIRTTHHWGWAMLSAALLLMAARRMLTLAAALSGRVDLHFQAESVALVISALTFAGVVAISPVFRRMSTLNERLGAQQSDLERNRDQLAALNTAALAMHAAESFDGLLEVIADHARHIIGAHQATTSVAIDSNWAQAIAGVSLSDKYAGYRDYDAPPDGSGIYAMVCETRQAVRMSQAQLEAHSRWKGFGKEAANHPPMRGWLAAPMVFGGATDVGLIQLSDRYEGEFSENDEALLLQLAEMASVIVRLRRSQAVVEERSAALARTNALLEQEVADHKRAREQLVTAAHELREHNIELARSNQDLDDFAYIASHDLKEPLRGIHNYSGFLLEDYRDRLGEEGRSKLETLARLSQRLETLIDDLLYYSRVGRTQLSLAPTSIQDVVDDVVETLAEFLRDNQVTLRLQGELPTVICDRVRVGEVFRHLITNAAKYNDKAEKWIEVGASRAPECEEKGESNSPVVFFVRDNGLGMREQHRENVFRIFKRLHGRGKFGGGSGVGLTIAKKIVERHGGRIWAESSYGEGTTFFFTLEASEDGRTPEDDPHRRG